MDTLQVIREKFLDAIKRGDKPTTFNMAFHKVLERHGAL